MIEFSKDDLKKTQLVWVVHQKSNDGKLKGEQIFTDIYDAKSYFQKLVEKSLHLEGFAMFENEFVTSSGRTWIECEFRTPHEVKLALGANSC